MSSRNRNSYRNRNSWSKWLACLGAVGASIVSIAILIQTSSPDAHINGCGGGGCESAWASQWSSLFGLPVAIGAVVVYLVLFFLVLWKPNRHNIASINLRKGALLLVTTVALLSILYFLGIQVLVLKQVCKWCLAAHLTGMLAVAGVLLLRPWTRESGDNSFSNYRPTGWVIGGTALFVVFSILQAYDPGHETHRLINASSVPVILPLQQPATAMPETVESLDLPIDNTPIAPRAAVPEPVIATLELPDGTRVERAHFPTIGPVDAELVIFKLYDYTCGSCKNIHDDLEELWSDLPGAPALILIPCPLNRACNPDLPTSIENHKNACELARIGLALWRVAPGQFQDYHRWAFANQPSPQEALEYAGKLGGSPELDAALADPGIDADIALAIRLFAVSGQERMPQLYLPNRQVLIGVTRTTEETLQILKRALNGND